MATTIKAKDGTIRKEKKLAPSSSSHTIRTIRSSKPTLKTSISVEKHKHKSLPHNLNPKSRSESLKNVKANDQETTQKSLRRKYLGGPQVSVRMQKPVITSDVKLRAGGRDRVITVTAAQSSSFSGIKPALNRSSSSANKPVRSQPAKSQPLPDTRRLQQSSAGPLKCSGLSAKSENKSKPNSNSLTGPSSSTQDPSPTNLETETETNPEKIGECLVHEGSKTVNPDSELQVLPDIQKDNEPINDSDQLNNNFEPDKVEPFETVTVSEVQNHESCQAEIESELESINGDIEEVKAKAGEEKAGSSEEVAEEKKQENGRNGDHGVEVEGVETPSSARHGGSERKRESPAYNDVIEETQKKLMEKRKNKVKALVGAFETVIDYETAAAK